MRPDDSYVGIPYLDKGRDRGGVDCWGLVRLYYAEQFGIALPSLDDDYASGLARDQVAQTVRAETAAHWSPIAAPCRGDVVITTICERPFHVGIVLGGGYFLHALCEAQGASIERLDSLRWRNRIGGYYRHEHRS